MFLSLLLRKAGSGGKRPSVCVIPLRQRSFALTSAQQRSGILAPNYVPRNLDLPRLEALSDWLLARLTHSDSEYIYM